MKLIKILFVVATAFATGVSAPGAYAESKVAECAEFRNPTSSATATAITLRVDVYAKCTSEELGRGVGKKPLYEMPEEESLFNLGSCSGPAINPIIGNGWLGTATCTLRIGSNSLPSTRSGATSTIIKMWFAWDFSSKTVSVPHKLIPSATNNGWGGSSSGSSSGVGSPIIKSCTSAPETPNLSVVWNEKGPLFKFSLSNASDKESDIYWQYVLYDSLKGAWGSWTAYKKASQGNSGEYQASPELNKTKIAFGVYAVNTCGSSGSAREISSNTGVPLTPLIQDSLTFTFPENRRIEVGEEIDIYGIVTSKLMLPLSASTISPGSCEVSKTGKVKMLAIGECKLLFTTAPFQQNAGALPTEFSMTIKAKRITQSIPDLAFGQQFELTKSPLILRTKTDAGLDVSFSSLTDDVCLVVGDKLLFQSSGICQLRADQDGDENTLIAETRFFDIQVTPKKTTVTCTKGKLSKKVSGYSPKCPAGYKIKK